MTRSLETLPCCASLLVILLAVVGWGQKDSGTIVGTVKDVSGRGPRGSQGHSHRCGSRHLLHHCNKRQRRIRCGSIESGPLSRRCRESGI